MNYIVFDLEWNQSSTKFRENKRMPFEIIEIGAVRLNEQGQYMDSFQSLVRPVVYRHMHNITENLVHIHEEELQKARYFTEVMHDFLEFCGEEYRFCTWGSQDVAELQQNMDFHGMEPLSGRPLPFYDVQKLFSLRYDDGRSRKSLKSCVEFLELENPEVPFHRAFADAYYTSLIFQRVCSQELLQRVSFDTYRLPVSKEDEVHWQFDTYSKYISTAFPDKHVLLGTKRATAIRCLYCDRPLRRQTQWFSPNGKNYYNAGSCGEHGMMRCKIRVCKAGEDRVFAVKTIRPMKETEMEEFEKMRTHAAQHKARKRTNKGQ
ncbi:MAG: exonuclease domain-containing protein [Lachnospiraceae bacterium]|nr:exonuclease domain-containing protein [Lachnospiraceae bacterium]